MPKFISSFQNPFVKNVKGLYQKARERKKVGLFPVEGDREVDRALRSGYQLATWIFPEMMVESVRDQWVNRQPEAEEIVLKDEVFGELAYRMSKDHLIGLFKIPSLHFEDLKMPKDPLVIVSESPEKPGNLGAMLRTADAAGVDLFIVTDSQVDVFHPNVVRNSLGGIFGVPVLSMTNSDALKILKKLNTQILTTHLEASVPYDTVDQTGPIAIVVGSEAEGVTDFWVKNADQRVIIPMQGLVDSLNLSVSAAILIFEADRQRRSLRTK